MNQLVRQLAHQLAMHVLRLRGSPRRCNRRARVTQMSSAPIAPDMAVRERPSARKRAKGRATERQRETARQRGRAGEMR